MDVVLVAGLWLDGTAWDQVLPAVEARGHRPVPVTLPGQGDGDRDATLDDQVAAVVAAVDAAEGPAVVVGHSAACSLAWLAADARPDRVDRVVLVGGMPNDDGEPYVDVLPVVDGAVPFPGWEQFEGPDAADLGEATRDRIAAAAIPLPEGVARGVVRLGDERRHDVPVTLVCPEFSPSDAQAWLDGGHIPSLARAEVDLVDIDSGHWPMFSRPTELGQLLADAADRG